MIDRITLFASLCVLCVFVAKVSRAQDSPAPVLQIESFGPVRAYAVGTETVTLVGTIRNVGNAPLAAQSVRARLYNLTGLDYLEGDTAPKLPALEPNAAVTYRWRVQPIAADTALIASLVLEGAGALPMTRIVSIPRFAEAPTGDKPTVAKEPTARAGQGEAVIENERLRARFAFTRADVPALFLSCRATGVWRQVGIALPIAEALSGEGGQRPWWEVFKGDDFQTSHRPGEATLTLTGAFGLRWRATLDFTLRAASSVLDVRLRLAPLKPLKLSGLRLCSLLVGEGSFGAMATETLGPEPSGSNSVTALRWGEITVGVLRPDTPPLPNGKTAPLPNIEGANYRLFGTETLSSNGPALLQPGALIDARVRLFALTPSLSVNEARQITFPAMAQIR